ncbi:MAG TPA: ABC transporter ATP-binding protein [Arcobacter sp.]|jgi:peptide/nickel transport system ATP-binding protein|nr:ABC transporter ATP-binding protein [Arcobacter sp.]
MSQHFNINSLQIKTKDTTLVDISFKVKSSLALVGQSGSGKSLTLKSILNLMPTNLELFLEIDSSFEQNPQNISYVPQNPFTSLSPLTKIKKQFFVDKTKQIELCKLVELDKEVLDKFPRELSGGQLQRIVIAIALSHNPKLLLLDEPTTALDSKTKNTIVSLLQKIQKKLDFLIIFVTHDLESIKELCDEIAILHKGKIVETGLTNNILLDPKKQYTKNLIVSNFSNREFRI